MQNLSLRERRLLALAILLGVAAASWLLVVAPILGGFAGRREERDAAQASLARNAQLIASLPRIRTEAARARAALPRYAVVAGSPAAAAERTRERLTALVSGAGGVLEAVRQQSGTASTLRYELDFRTDLSKLQAVLQRLETEAPLANVAGLSVSTDPAEIGAPPLRIRLDVVYASALPS